MQSRLLLHTISNRFLRHLPTLPSDLHEMLGSDDVLGSNAQPRGRRCSDVANLTLRQLLIECAHAIAGQDFELALQYLQMLEKRVQIHGDATERVGFFFAKSLATKLAPFISSSKSIHRPIPILGFDSEQLSGSKMPAAAAHLALNQVTPFTRFAHLTANQAILEAVENESMLHIIDFGIMQGVQWPPLMQALAERESGPPMLRITGTGPSVELLEQTGIRLAEFAKGLNLPFEFCAVPESLERVTLNRLNLRSGEALAINCMMQLHRLLQESNQKLISILDLIRQMGPKVVAIAEKEANFHELPFLDRFIEALDHYSAMFESLEATLPARSSERSCIEQVLLGAEILNIISADQMGRAHRHQRFRKWKELLESCGFVAVPLSSFASAQARLLLRLHYPSEGYSLLEGDDFCLFLGWQNTPLFAVSSWHSN